MTSTKSFVYSTHTFSYLQNSHFKFVEELQVMEREIGNSNTLFCTFKNTQLNNYSWGVIMLGLGSPNGRIIVDI